MTYVELRQRVRTPVSAGTTESTIRENSDEFLQAPPIIASSASQSAASRSNWHTELAAHWQ